MNEEINSLRKALSLNIKKQRAILGISQEKLAEKAGISANMVNDIEGCRTWVSDKTLINIAKSLEIEVYRLLLPAPALSKAVNTGLAFEITDELLHIKKDFDNQFENALKSRGFL
jgi:transcriptional regulator with XRE-family HTH domain